MDQMAAFNSGLEDALNVTERIQERLEKVRGLLGGILTITDVSNVAQFAGFVSAIAGGIDLPIPEIELDDAAIMQIAAEAQMGLNGDGDLAQFASWLAEVRAVIMEIDNVITQVQDQLETGGEFANEIQDLIALADFVGLSNDLKTEVKAYLAATVNAAGTQPGDYSPAEIDDAIRAMIRDRLYAMDFTAQLHNVLKRWIEPVTDSVELAVHEALNAVAAAIIDAAAPYLQQLDDAIASFTGFGNPVKSAKLRGDAVIVGDRLKKLDLLGTAVITPVEPSEIQVDALFQWCEYRSDGHLCLRWRAGRIESQHLPIRDRRAGESWVSARQPSIDRCQVHHPGERSSWNERLLRTRAGWQLPGRGIPHQQLQRQHGVWWPENWWPTCRPSSIRASGPGT